MIQASRFEIHTEPLQDGVLLSVVGELDLATAPRLEEAVQAQLAAGISRIVVDLSPLTFVDSSGLRLLIVLDERAGHDGWSLGLIRAPGPPQAVFQITGADKNLPFIEDPRPRS